MWAEKCSQNRVPYRGSTTKLARGGRVQRAAQTEILQNGTEQRSACGASRTRYARGGRRCVARSALHDERSETGYLKR